MKAENTYMITTYLRDKTEEDRQVRQRILADMAKGRGRSEIVRKALRDYYFPPAPKPDKTLVKVTEALSLLAAQVEQLRAQVIHHQAQQTETDQLRGQIESLRRQLTDVVTNDQLRDELRRQLKRQP